MNWWAMVIESLYLRAFRLLRNKQSIDELEETEEIVHLKAWLAVKSKRGLHGFIGN